VTPCRPSLLQLQREDFSSRTATAIAPSVIQPGPFNFWAVAETLESLDQADQIREQL
jgi:hypothetical protein